MLSAQRQKQAGLDFAPFCSGVYEPDGRRLDDSQPRGPADPRRRIAPAGCDGGAAWCMGC